MKPKKGGGGFGGGEGDIYIVITRRKNWKTESRKKLVFAGKLEGI